MNKLTPNSPCPDHDNHAASTNRVNSMQMLLASSFAAVCRATLHLGMMCHSDCAISRLSPLQNPTNIAALCSPDVSTLRCTHADTLFTAEPTSGVCKVLRGGKTILLTTHKSKADPGAQISMYHFYEVDERKRQACGVWSAVKPGIEFLQAFAQSFAGA
jgi:hypothetical protein